MANGTIDIVDLLDLRDLERDGTRIASFFDSTKLAEIADKVVSGGNSQPITRPYVDDPLRIFMTVSNLRGVPYWMLIHGNAAEGHGMNSARDHMRFALSRAQVKSYPDEVDLTLPASPISAPWQKLAQAAMASGAFPGALQARVLERNYADYKHRIVFQVGVPSSYTAAAPSRIDGNNGSYSFVAVDGGAMNNEPQELARRILAGALGHSPRESRKAYRATVMVDPFPQPPDLGPSDQDHADAISALGALIGAWTNQARFTAEEIALANAPEVYSRFLIAPSRKGIDAISNGYSLAASALGGFGGFLSRHYRVHDFLLGRYNCQQFLKQWFVLHKDNPIFKCCSNPDLDGRIFDVRFTDDPDVYRQIIPLVKKAATLEPAPLWPTGLFSWSSVEERALERIKRLYFACLESLEVSWYAKTYLIPFRLFLHNRAKSKLRDWVQCELKNRNL